MKRYAFVLVALVGCHESSPARRPVRETSDAMSLTAIPDAPVSGTLAGRPFTLRSAWLRVRARSNQSRVDLVLSEGRPGRLCSRPTPNDARQLVVRFRGVTALSAETVRIDAASPGHEVFAEWRGAHGSEGVGGGSAAVVLERVTDAEVVGRLRVCLPDAHGSCVGGTFRAQPCWDELDLDGPRGARDRAPDGGVVEDVPSRGGRTADGGVPDGGAR